MDSPVYKLESVVRTKTEELEDFEGPLDLILYLLSKDKIEIQDIPIARILDQYLAYLADGLANYVNIFQPEAICLGGGASGAEDDLLLAPLREMVWRGCFDKENKVRIERASLGNNAGIVGAALLGNLV